MLDEHEHHRDEQVRADGDDVVPEQRRPDRHGSKRRLFGEETESVQQHDRAERGEGHAPGCSMHHTEEQCDEPGGEQDRSERERRQVACETCKLFGGLHGAYVHGADQGITTGRRTYNASA